MGQRPHRPLLHGCGQGEVRHHLPVEHVLLLDGPRCPAAAPARWDLAARYSRCLDGRRKEAFLELFTEGGVWDFGPTFGAAHGREQIERLFDMMMQLFTETRHLAGNVVVAVDGDTATGEVDAYAVAIDTSGRQHSTFASYDDSYAFDGGAWRIARRTVTMHTPPNFS